VLSTATPLILLPVPCTVQYLPTYRSAASPYATLSPMPFLTSPTSFRNNEFLSSLQHPPSSYLMTYSTSFSNGSIPLDFSIMAKGQVPHSSHPALGHLILLVFEAVLEVVCVALPGYIIARYGMFDAEMQKFVANLNVLLFTPCLSEFARLPQGVYARAWLTRDPGISFHEACESADFGENR